MEETKLSANLAWRTDIFKSSLKSWWVRNTALILLVRQVYIQSSFGSKNTGLNANLALLEDISMYMTTHWQRKKCAKLASGAKVYHNTFKAVIWLKCRGGGKHITGAERLGTRLHRVWGISVYTIWRLLSDQGDTENTVWGREHSAR